GEVSEHLWYFPDVLPTVAEITGAKPPADIDGISIVPELFGAKAVGREQKQHEYLYWELGQQVAVRWNDWKAVKRNAKADWELYNLKTDISETENVASTNPDVLKRVQGFAKAAHVDAVEGTFQSTILHERDRQAKWGEFRQPRRRRAGKNKKLPQKGLIPTAELKIHRISSEARGNGKTGASMIDGDSRTHWHSQFSNGIKKHPHEIVIDMGQTRTVSGVRYMSRQDGGWNGALANCEFAVGNSPMTFPSEKHNVTFEKTRSSQEAAFSGTGRYLHIRILSEVNNGPWASIAEIGVIGK
ncbi:MAG: discoidin domain-containing protein, partial [Planctomycetaceae bacterium]